MKLTKEQIQFIDKRLKNSGLEYWDVRIELLDHIVSDIEKTTTKEDDFKKAVQDSFVSLGWKGNFEGLNRQSWKNTNKIYRKKYLKGFVDFFRKTSNLLIFLTCFAVYFKLSDTLIFKDFIKLSILLFIIPLSLILIAYIKIGLKQYGKSVNIAYALFYLSFFGITFQGIPMFSSNATEITQKIIWLIFIPIYYVSIYSGYKVFNYGFKKAEKMRKELL